MKMDKKTIVLIVLAVVAVFVVVKQLGIFSSSKPTPAPAVVAAGPAAAKADGQASGAALLANKLQSIPADGYAALVATLKESDIAFDESGFKNPMTPARGESSRPKSWSPKSVEGPKITQPAAEVLAKNDSIEGIVWNDKDPLALVNNQVVGIGEKLEDGAVVTDITRDTVRFSRNGQRYYLVLREE